MYKKQRFYILYCHLHKIYLFLCSNGKCSMLCLSIGTIQMAIAIYTYTLHCTHNISDHKLNMWLHKCCVFVFWWDQKWRDVIRVRVEDRFAYETDNHPYYMRHSSTTSIYNTLQHNSTHIQYHILCMKMLTGTHISFFFLCQSCTFCTHLVRIWHLVLVLMLLMLLLPVWCSSVTIAAGTSILQNISNQNWIDIFFFFFIAK